MADWNQSWPDQAKPERLCVSTGLCIFCIHTQATAPPPPPPPRFDAGPGLLLERGARPLDGPQVCVRRVVPLPEQKLPHGAWPKNAISIGQAHRNFRFDLRYRALLGGTRDQLKQQIESGFPFLPAGCSLKLDRVSSERVLANLRESLLMKPPSATSSSSLSRSPSASSPPPPARTTTPSLRRSSTGRARASPWKPHPPASATSTMWSVAVGCCCLCAKKANAAG